MPDVSQLIQIRCPNKRFMPQYKKLMPCNRLCAEVYPGSRGRAFCRSCREYRKARGDQSVNPYFYYDVAADYVEPKTPHLQLKK